MNALRKLLIAGGMLALGAGAMAVPLAAGTALAAAPSSDPPVSLYLSPVGGSFTLGSTFSVSIEVNTGGSAINAVEADLSFPTDKLQVVSSNSGKSFIQIWVAQPSYSNVEGTLHFQGAIPSPGIVTSAGLISTITFRVVGTGTAAVRFLDTSRVLLNDGFATDALGQTTNGIYALTLPPPAGPIVTSPTNPDQNTWYRTTSVTFEWQADFPDVSGYSYVLNDTPMDTPDNISEGSNTSVTYNNVADGTHYFHIKALRKGAWGGVTDFAVRVDNTPPAAMPVEVLPGTYTTSGDVILQFQTTDAASGIDHYEVKVIPLDLGTSAAASNTPLFAEATSPYLVHLIPGKYDVVVRAYDLAGNFYQITTGVTVATPFSQIIGADGLHVSGSLVISWWYLIGAAVLIVLLVGLWLSRVWRRHRAVTKELSKGLAAHPEIAQKLAELKQKQQEYEDALKHLAMVVLAVLGIGWGLVGLGSAAPAHAADLALDPPIINLYPSSLGNDEVLYVGGWANAPGAKVQVFIQQSETGDTYSGTATAGADGNWFYSFPQLLDSGHYAIWAELQSGETVSQPSARVSVTISPTAVQIGNARLSHADFYLLLFLVCLGIALILFVAILIYARRTSIKRRRLQEMIRDAEEALSRGFAVLERDIQMELAAVERLARRGELSVDERLRETKLRRDLDDVRRYIGKELRRIEREEDNG